MKQNRGFIKGALFGALTVLIIGALSACQLGTKKVVNSDAEQKLESIQSLIDENYLSDSDAKELRDGLYKGYVNGLSDPYSVYYNEEETKALLEGTAGQYGGIGAVMSQDVESGIITIVKVYEDSPAQKAGVRDNDTLYKADGKEVTGIELTKVVSGIRGEKGTTVELEVVRNQKQITMTVTRDTVSAETVSHEMKEGQIGYIRVSEFDSVTYDQYKEALEDLQSQDMKGLIVDLRSNPGGNLDTVCDMLDLMLPKGLVVYTEDKDGNRTEEKSDEEHQFTLPMEVLVNGNSASASEIYAGAIQDYGIGDIVGTQTYGKGVVQQLFDMGDDTCLKLTVAEYFTPKGRNINGTGITPDVEVEYEADEANLEADNQLDAAMETLKNKL